MLVKLFNGKVVCPRCDDNGLIFKIEYQDFVFYICDECEATWEYFNEIFYKTFKDLQTLLEQRGLRYQEIMNIEGDYNWYNSY